MTLFRCGSSYNVAMFATSVSALRFTFTSCVCVCVDGLFARVIKITTEGPLKPFENWGMNNSEVEAMRKAT